MSEPERSARVEQFRKEHHHEIQLNIFRDMEEREVEPKPEPAGCAGAKPWTECGAREEPAQGEAASKPGLMGPPQMLKRMPAEINRNSKTQIDPATLKKKKVHGGGFLNKWPRERAWQEIRSAFE